MKTVLLTFLSVLPVLADSARISAQEFGKDWPFMVTEGVLSCSSGSAVLFAANKKIYAVNGAATTRKMGLDIAEIWSAGEPIWVTDPQTKKKVNIGPPKKDIGPIIQQGLKLCR